ncbi:MAG TPA: tRNA pseudouridine(38-40) synthase TruA [Chondromyces sp.]|nr:tRNA pseudouridine(38-40) synthase TruA [Chondromyces sp.]
MNRIKCVIAYDGTLFAGYQIQPRERTVQGELEQALRKVHKGLETKVTASGRTDAGVHAVGQVIHFDTPYSIPEEKWPIILNGLLPDDIAVKYAELTDSSFHARFSATGKEYRYRIYQSFHRSPHKRFYAAHYPHKLNIEAMEKAAGYLIGQHDFTSFCSAKTEVEDKVRRITDIAIVQDQEELELCFKGNGFLYNMVRILTGTLVEVGAEKLSPEEVKGILEAKDRSMAGKTAPAQGLYLWQVFYSN